MFPKLMSMAGNTIILDIICETGSQRVLTAGSELVSNSDKFAQLSLIPTLGWWPHITPAWLWLKNNWKKIIVTRYL